MAKIPRENIKVFAGSSRDASEFGVVGSFATGQPIVAMSAPPTTAEILETRTSYDNGLTDIVEDGQKLPTMEEFNSILYSITRWIKYVSQEGIMEYSPKETYYEYSIVKYNGRLFMCTVSSGIVGQPPPSSLPYSNSYWGRLRLASNSVDTDTINDRAVTEPKLADNAVSTRTIQNNAITTEKIINNAITTEKIINNAITTEKIRDGAVNGDKIKEGSITTVHIQENAITHDLLSEQLQEIIDNDELGEGSVGSNEIADGSITLQKLYSDLRKFFDVSQPDINLENYNVAGAYLMNVSCSRVGKVCILGLHFILSDPGGYNINDNYAHINFENVVAKNSSGIGTSFTKVYGGDSDGLQQRHHIEVYFESNNSIKVHVYSRSVTGRGDMSMSVSMSLPFIIE